MNLPPVDPTTDALRLLSDVAEMVRAIVAGVRDLGLLVSDLRQHAHWYVAELGAVIGVVAGGVVFVLAKLFNPPAVK